MVTTIKTETVQSIQHTVLVPCETCSDCRKTVQVFDIIEVQTESLPQTTDAKLCKDCFYENLIF